VNWSHYWF